MTRLCSDIYLYVPYSLLTKALEALLLENPQLNFSSTCILHVLPTDELGTCELQRLTIIIGFEIISNAKKMIGGRVQGNGFMCADILAFASRDAAVLVGSINIHFLRLLILYAPTKRKS